MIPNILRSRFRRAVAGLVLFCVMTLLMFALGSLTPAFARQSTSFLFEPRGFSALDIERPESPSFQVDVTAGHSVVGESSSRSFSVSDDYPNKLGDILFIPILINQP